MKKVTEKAIANVLAHTIKNHMPEGVFEIELKEQTYYMLTDSYRMIRLLSDVPALPHVENTLQANNIDRLFDRLAKKTEVLNLPTVKELKAWIKEKHIRRSNPGKTVFRIDSFTYVNPFFLLDMIQGLPGCVAYRPENAKTPIYFHADNSDGLLCPVMYIPD